MLVVDMTASREVVRARRLRDAAAVTLALTSGASDAVSFLALGGAFTSVMTGNLVLLGCSAVHGDPSLSARQLGFAVASYVGGAAAGARIAGEAASDDPTWPFGVTRGLSVEAGLFVIYAALWWVASNPTSNAVVEAGLVSLSGAALGIQSSVMKRFGVPRFSTTYFTNTLTTLVIRLATGGRRSPEVRRNLMLIAALVAGAAAATALLRHAAAYTPLGPLIPLAVVLLVVPVVGRRSRHVETLRRQR